MTEAERHSDYVDSTTQQYSAQFPSCAPVRTLLSVPRALLQTWAITLCLAALPGLALAAGVRNLQASEQNGQIRVQWDAPATGTITAYNVYFSGRSILRNDGEYDDYEKTSGSRTEFILTDYPKSTGSVYIAVLPVDAQGKEMDSFTEEVRVALGLGGQDTASSAGQTASASTTALQVFGAQATSSTGVVLMFNLPITLTAANAPNAIHIEDGSGASVRIKRLILRGAEAGIETEPMTPGTEYRVTVFPVITATNGVRLAGSTATITFVTPGNRPASVSSRASSATSNTLEVENLEVRAEPQANGKFLVMAAWDPPQGSFVSYVVRKSRNGKAVGTPQTLPFTTTFARFAEEPAAHFTVTVQVVAPSGALSAGQSASIDLVLEPNSSPTPTPAPGGSGKLTSSGLGVVGVMAVTGAMAGMWRMRRRKM